MHQNIAQTEHHRLQAKQEIRTVIDERAQKTDG